MARRVARAPKLAAGDRLGGAVGRRIAAAPARRHRSDGGEPRRPSGTHRGGTMTADQYDTGMRVRREVLGDQYVDRATSAAGIDADFQRWITESAWGGLWAREAQLDRRTRSCITVAVLTALRAEGELALHLRAARRNGLTPEELAEVIMHTAAYAGIPAANSAMTIARHVLADPD